MRNDLKPNARNNRNRSQAANDAKHTKQWETIPSTLRVWVLVQQLLSRRSDDEQKSLPRRGVLLVRLLPRRGVSEALLPRRGVSVEADVRHGAQGHS